MNTEAEGKERYNLAMYMNTWFSRSAKKKSKLEKERETLGPN
jgi:hypothetical protein